MGKAVSGASGPPVTTKRGGRFVRLLSFVGLTAAITVGAPALAAFAYTETQYVNGTVVAEYVGVNSVSGTHVGGKSAVSGTSASLYTVGRTIDANSGVVLFATSAARGGPVGWTHASMSVTRIRVSWDWTGSGSVSPLAVYGWRRY